MAIEAKRIAKNTIFLYARLILVFGVTIYTSRVVLDKLGVDDYGLYNVVFSVIGMLSFLNGTLSSGTSRFITFDLGKKDTEILKTTFSTSLCTHLLLAGFIILIGETIGIWYVYNVMVCPPDRFSAALVVYQISILITVVSIIQVPFTSEIMAHEEMDIYAYIGIYEAIAKLVIVYLLARSPFDRMVFYASLVAIVSFSVCAIYIYFSNKKFEEVQFKIKFDRGTFKDILKFSGWNIIANFSNTVMKQGVILLFNLFFAPVVAAAQNISVQVSNAMMQFVYGVYQAINPQVIKSYADGRYDDSKRLTLESTEYVFDLLLLMGIPLIVVMPKLMSIWLVEVPDYAIAFTQLLILQDILGIFNISFYTPMVAANKIQKNSYASAILCVAQFGLLYLLFKIGCGPIWSRYIGLVFCVIWSCAVKPYILWKDVNYTLREMFSCILRCLRNLAVVGIICYSLSIIIPQNTILQMLAMASLCVFVVTGISLLFMHKESREKLISLFIQKIHHRTK